MSSRIGGDEGIGGQHRARLAGEHVLELVAERGAGVVALGLERHAEQPDGHLGEVVAALEVVDHVQHQALVDQDRGVAETELIAREGRELHRVLDQAGAGGKARPRHALERG